LDDLSRQRLRSGDLQDLTTTKHVVGLTTNPSIFQAALADGAPYRQQIGELAASGLRVCPLTSKISELSALTWADMFDWHGWTFGLGISGFHRCESVSMNLLRTVGRAGPKPQLAPDGPSIRASCNGTHHHRAGLKAHFG
jgi:hypothetical protein